jgi:hypothetical protein
MATPSARAPARTAIVYDFDGTLAPGNIQEHSFLPELGLNTDTFWDEVGALKEQHDADEILVYMWRMLEHARARGVPITRDLLRAHGRKTPLFAGVETWFSRVNEYASARGLALDHYVISSGNHEMIAGCPIYDRFTRIFASSFIYDDRGHAVWPGVAINYTTKTQFLFRINKGIDNSWDKDAVNRWMPMDERPVPFARMLFIGDGDTDIPSMKMVRHQGGMSIAVFDPKKWSERQSQDKLGRLIAEDRAHFVAPADYTEGSQLEVVVKGILGRFARDAGYRG